GVGTRLQAIDGDEQRGVRSAVGVEKQAAQALPMSSRQRRQKWPEGWRILELDVLGGSSRGLPRLPGVVDRHSHAWLSVGAVPIESSTNHLARYRTKVIPDQEGSAPRRNQPLAYPVLFS